MTNYNKNTLKIYIVEDEPLILETIKILVEEGGFQVCGTSDNAQEAIFDIDQLQPNLVLLDIILEGELDGVDLANRIRAKHNIPFIFLTSLSDEDTLKRVNETNSSGFIVKPFNENTLIANIELALYKHYLSNTNLSLEQESDSFFIKYKGEFLKINKNDILYFEAYDNYCYVHTITKKHLISHSLKSVEQKLPKSKFLRVHRSYIINFSKIDSIQEGYVYIQKHKISVSKSHKEALMTTLNLL
ncbi:MAG: response regulator [Flavobacteriaceae bacterium]|nr:response regulator [Flavobacteriaceae bacterium]